MAESTLRIYICGGHSTGKTTILKDLLAGVNIKPELDVARGLMQQLGLDRSLIDAKTHPDNFESFQLHVMTRLLEIDRANSADGIDFVCDRGIDPLVYTAVYLGSDSASRLMQTDVAVKFVERLSSAEIFVVTPHEQLSLMTESVCRSRAWMSCIASLTSCSLSCSSSASRITPSACSTDSAESNRS